MIELQSNNLEFRLSVECNIEHFLLGSSWRIHLSEATRERLEKAGGYHIEPRGGIEIKGKGLMNTYWLLGKKGFDKVLPTPPPIG